MDTLKSSDSETAQEPPDYIFDLIQVSLLAAAHDIPGLITAVQKARAAGADNREILRAMFRSDDAFVAGIEDAEFLRLAESLQAGLIPVPSA
ncbi:MAG: hypothetical protein OHK0011_08120 [Turneriella sp.]